MQVADNAFDFGQTRLDDGIAVARTELAAAKSAVQYWVGRCRDSDVNVTQLTAAKAALLACENVVRAREGTLSALIELQTAAKQWATSRPQGVAVTLETRQSSDHDAYAHSVGEDQSRVSANGALPPPERLWPW